MRKIILFLLPLLFCVVITNAQTADATKAEAMELAVKNSIGIGLSSTELSNVIVSDAYFDKSSGLNMVYLQQTYKGILVYNQIMVLAFKNGVLLSSAGKYNHSIEKFVNVQSALPTISAQASVLAAIADRKLVTTQAAVAINVKNNGQKVEFGNMGVSRENITAQLMWVPATDEKAVNLAWQVYIIPTTSSDYWLVRMDATNSKLLGADNLTVYCNWGNNKHTHAAGEKHNFKTDVPASNYKPLFDFEAMVKTTAENASSPSTINSSSYRVVPYPAESPQAVGGAHALRTDPWTAAPGNATTLKWHTGAGGVDYDYTRGNNVWAYQDRVAPLNSGTVAKSTTSTTGLPNLTFDFTPNYTVTPLQTTPAPNVQFNTTNVFYWNNIIHDVMYQYGFDEVAGNFQDDNLSRGGAGNDHVNAEAQDASGTNNANFSTPADGTSGRMQMFLFDINGSSPVKDGDVDNGIVVHEFGHGLSNRLTGGPSNVSCLNNAESMGEGWSDYYALMFTTNWATATLSDGVIPRPMGLYALNNVNLFPGSPPNTGIRHYAYSTNLAVNPLVYAASIPAETHDLGEIWCAVVWDMTWAIINQVGVINPNIYDVTGGGGNNIAMRLVTEGMKLQQCSPGFISGRNAILQADLNLYGGTYRCAIIAAFARRGMGTNASEGSTSSTSDQVADFTGGGPSILLTQNGTISVPEGQNIVYNNKVVAECAAISNYVLRDTLPLNVSFVSANNGGTYNDANRVVSWPVTLAANAIGNYGFTVNINAGAYFPPLVLINEPVASTTIPAFWTATSTTANVWTAHNVRSHSAPNSFFTPNSATVSDQIIATTANFAIGVTPPTLSFWHWYNSESTFDGGVLEISTNGGGTWADIGAANIIQNGYNGTISTGFSNPIGGRQAWTGNSAAFVESRINLLAYASQPTVKLRWRFGTDNSVTATGWNVDDITLQTIAVVNMRSGLFNAANVRVVLSDTVTIITAPVATNPTVTINQAVGQADPTSTAPINFTAVFNEAVTGFTNTDVVLSGTAGATTVVVTGGPATYNVAVSGMATAGTVIATIPASVATSTASSLPNTASTSTDNVVTYNIAGPCVITCPANITVNATAGQCGAVVNFAAPTSTGTCGTITVNPASGAVFPVGLTTVNVTSTSGSTCSFTITVVDNQAPIITCPANINLCSSQIVNYSLPTATDNCSAIVSQTAGLPSGSVFPVGTTVNTFQAVDPAGNISTCSFNVLINPVANAIATPPTQTICSAASIATITLTSSTPGTVFSWTRNNTATVTGIAAAGTGNITGTLTNTTFAPITVTFTITASVNGCPGSNTSATVLVNPTANVQTGTSGNLFFNGALSIADPTYNRPLAYAQGGACALSGVGTAVHYKTHTFTITSPTNVTVSLVSTDGGAVTPGSGDTFLQLLGPGGFTPTATCTNSIAANDDAVGAISRIITTTPLAAGTYTAVVSSFDNTPTDFPWTYTLAVLLPAGPPGPLTNQTVCNNTATTAVNFLSSVAGATFSWTNSTPSVGLAASGTGNLPSFTATNNTAAPVVATINVTPSANGCPGTPSSFTITVNPTPTVLVTPAAQTICSASPITTVALTGNIATTTYNWTRNNTATVTGIAASGTGNITGTLTNTTVAPVTVTFTITPTVNGCSGTSTTATVLVNPTPDVLAGGTGNLFFNGTLSLTDPTYNRPLSYNQGGACALSGAGTAVHYKTHTFTITNPTNVTVSLVNADGGNLTPTTGDTFLQLLGPGGFTPTATCTNSVAANDDAVGVRSRIVTTTPLAIGTYTVVVTSFGNTPADFPWTYTLAVLLPASPILPSQVVCNNATTTAASFSGSVTGTIYNWTNNTPSIGLAAAGSGAIPSFTAINTTAAPVVATITVTPIANGCPGTAKTFTITVNPSPVVNAIANQAVCNGLPTAAVAFSSATVGTTFAWTNNTTSIGLAASGNGNIASFNAINPGTTPVVATISVTPTGGGCVGAALAFTITVNPTPIVTLAPFAAICRNAGSLTLTGGSPTTGGTGVYFVDGMLQTVFNPGNYTPGLHTVVYQFTTTAGCVNTATQTINVYPLHVVVITVAPNAGLKPGMPATVIATVSPADNYTYQWVKNGNINLASTADRIVVQASEAGNYKVIVTAPTGCVVTSDNAFTTSMTSEQLFIFPNPNSGLFNVSYNNGGANLTARTLTVYDAKGAIVFTQSYSVNVPYGNMVVDIRSKAKGQYYVALRDSNNKKLATATIQKL